jgi:photosystem II stability/assembly factor-like uncharacterized protein
LNRLANMGLGLLAVLAVVMSVVALKAASGEPSERGDAVGVESTPTGSASPSPTRAATDEPSEEPSGEASETSTAEPLLPDEWFAALRFGTLVRAPAQDCVPGAPALTVSTSEDKGTTFVDTEVEDLAAVSGINIVSPDEATILGADFECETAMFATTDGGKTWKQRYTSPRFWSLLPGTEDQLQSPEGKVDVPCVPRAVSGLDSNVARLWCEDGQLMGTATGGNSWIVLGRVPEGHSLAFPTVASGYVLAETDDCTGTAVLTTEDAGAHWEQVHCSTIDGPWGLAAEGRLVVITGGAVADASPDAGRTWRTR